MVVILLLRDGDLLLGAMRHPSFSVYLILGLLKRNRIVKIVSILQKIMAE